jgi:GSH-dependent disulfide-bond oxidoreductase
MKRAPQKTAAKTAKTAKMARTSKVAKIKAAKSTAAARGDRPGAGKPQRRAGPQRPVRAAPIELYFWPTPNGWKISIMLEECGLPYVVRPVDISRGEQFTPQFLAISPNNRMPAIVDPRGPGGRPISVFESGAILQYLGRKTAKFYPREERARVAVEEWLFWQMGGLGPMAGQAMHFRRYAPEQIPYAVARYGNEVNRLFGVMNTRLAERDFLAGRYSIADMACVGWVRLADRLGEDLTQFPNLKRWYETIRARPAVQRGFAIRVEAASSVDMNDPKVRAVLFTQRAR